MQLFRGLRSGWKGTLVDVAEDFFFCFRFDLELVEADFRELTDGELLVELADFLDESLQDRSVDVDVRLEQDSGPRIE